MMVIDADNGQPHQCIHVQTIFSLLTAWQVLARSTCLYVTPNLSESDEKINPEMPQVQDRMMRMQQHNFTRIADIK